MNTFKNSSLSLGHVRHRRKQTINSSFKYPIFFFDSDLEEIDSICAQSRLLSRNKKNVLSFHDNDYLSEILTEQDATLKQRVFHVVKEKFGPEYLKQINHVKILTNWRCFNYIINPITIFTCHNQASELEFIILEVTNTPWDQRVIYPLRCDPKNRIQRIKFDKEMHVSPFFEMNMQYELRCHFSKKSIHFHLENWQENEKVFDATLGLNQQDITNKAINKTLLQFPAATIGVVSKIYWQALKLWVRKVKYRPNPHKLSENTYLKSE